MFEIACLKLESWLTFDLYWEVPRQTAEPVVNVVSSTRYLLNSNPQPLPLYPQCMGTLLHLHGLFKILLMLSNQSVTHLIVAIRLLRDCRKILDQRHVLMCCPSLIIRQHHSTNFDLLHALGSKSAGFHKRDCKATKE